MFASFAHGFAVCAHTSTQLSSVSQIKWEIEYDNWQQDKDAVILVCPSMSNRVQCVQAFNSTDYAVRNYMEMHFDCCT